MLRLGSATSTPGTAASSFPLPLPVFAVLLEGAGALLALAATFPTSAVSAAILHATLAVAVATIISHHTVAPFSLGNAAPHAPRGFLAFPASFRI